MTWEAISAIAQILGVIAVVVTLVYLAAQVRQGNLFARLQARQRMIEQAHSELYAQIADPSISHSNTEVVERIGTIRVQQRLRDRGR
jgi:hypothetical protein